MDVEWPGCGAKGRFVGGEEIEHARLSGKRQGCGPQPESFQDEAAILIDGFRGDILLGGMMGRATLDQHGKTPGAMRVITIRPAPAEFYFTHIYMSWYRGRALAMVPTRNRSTNTSRGTITFGTIRLTP
jgi:hypothetical protein